MNKKIVIQMDFFNHIGVPIFVKNLNGEFIFCNGAFLDLAGLADQKSVVTSDYQVFQRRLNDLFEFPEVAWSNFMESATYNTLLTSSENNKIQIRLYQSTIYGLNQKPIGLMGVIERRSEFIKKFSEVDEALSARQSEILNLMATGKSVKTIANLLALSPHTVTDHIKSIYLKLNVHSKSEAIYKALASLKFPAETSTETSAETSA